VLAAVVIRSGSIYPAVLWHFLNNAVAVVPTRLGWVDASSRIPGWLYITATVALALSLLLVGEPRASKGRSPHKVTT
jgi:hypothetical protein